MAQLIEQPPLTTVRDPVCGMDMNRSDAIAMRQVNGTTYYFCSHDCAVAFDAEPSRYIAPASATTGVPAGGAAQCGLQPGRPDDTPEGQRPVLCRMRGAD
jgi:Cu+-exporting ATPase